MTVLGERPHGGSKSCTPPPRPSKGATQASHPLSHSGIREFGLEPSALYPGWSILTFILYFFMYF